VTNTATEALKQRRQEQLVKRAGFLGGFIPWKDGVMTRPSRFSPEVRGRAVCMVLEHQDGHEGRRRT